MWNQVCQALPGVALCDLDDGELRDGRWDPNLVRSGSSGGGDVDESCEEGVHGAVPVVDRGALVIGERDSREHPLKVVPVSYTHLRAHETPEHLVCRLLLEKKKKTKHKKRAKLNRTKADKNHHQNSQK